MQTLTETPFEYRVTLGRAARIFRFLWRYLRKEPEVLEPFLASVKRVPRHATVTSVPYMRYHS
jgi:hypothetical protein